MTKKELQKRIIELEDLVNHQKRLIDVLYIQLDEKQLPFTYPPIPVQQGDCPAGGWHEYPNPYSITPPFCIKCGHQAPDMTPTYTTSNDNDIN